MIDTIKLLIYQELPLFGYFGLVVPLLERSRGTIQKTFDIKVSLKYRFYSFFVCSFTNRNIKK